MTLPTRKIFLLDDDADFLCTTKEILLEAGYSATACDKPAESLRAIREYKPDCLLLDLKMPLLDGNEFLPWVRRQFPDLAIVICTAVHDIRKRHLGRYGVRFFLQKPFSHTILFQTLEHAMADQTERNAVAVKTSVPKI